MIHSIYCIDYYNYIYFYRAQEDESSSEFSFTSSLMEALDGQGKKVHFGGVHKY